MKFHPVQPLLVIVAGLAFSCGSDGDFSPAGTYRATLVMEDASRLVVLDLRADGTASLKGLHAKTARGNWVKEAIGMGFSKDGVLATFDAERSNTKYRVVLMLQQADEGLVLADLRVRLLLDKPNMLQSLKLKEEKPLLRKDN